MESLIQQLGPERRELIYEEFGVRFRKKFIASIRERSVIYEDLLIDRIERRGRLEGVSFFLSLLFLLFTAIAADQGNDPRDTPNWPMAGFWMVLCMGSTAYCWARSGTFVVIPVAEQEVIEVYAARPNPEAVDRFTKKLAEHVREYSNGKYGMIDNLTPPDEQLKRITWLRNRNFIDDNEFRSKSELLQSRIKAGPEKPIGFRTTE